MKLVAGAARKFDYCSVTVPGVVPVTVIVPARGGATIGGPACNPSSSTFPPMAVTPPPEPAAAGSGGGVTAIGGNVLLDGLQAGPPIVAPPLAGTITVTGTTPGT